jgi:hypothetical protein
MREVRNSLKILAGSPQGKRPVGRARRGWEGNTKMDYKDVSLCM